MWRLAVALAAILVAWPDPAQACSCGRSSFISPADGATNVPRDAVVIFEGGSSDPIRLFDSASVEVATTTTELSTSSDHALIVVPAAPLAASATYSISHRNEWGAATTSTFTTGTDFAGARAAATTLAGFEVSLVDPGVCNLTANCIEDGPQLLLEYDTPAASIAIGVVVIRRSGGPPEWRLPVTGGFGSSRWWRRGIGGTSCSPPAPLFAAGETYCASLVTYDVSGREATSNEVCASVVGCHRNSICELECDSNIAVDAGVDAGKPLPRDESMCGVAVGGRSSNTGALWLLLLAASGALVGRGRRSGR